MRDRDDIDKQAAEDMDPSVPADLLQLHLDLEDIGMTPEQLAKAVRDEG